MKIFRKLAQALFPARPAVPVKPQVALTPPPPVPLDDDDGYGSSAYR